VRDTRPVPTGTNHREHRDCGGKDGILGGQVHEISL
jgi:hypothetical protein